MSLVMECGELRYEAQLPMYVISLRLHFFVAIHVVTTQPYDGQRTYESLSEFAKEYISKPVCSVKNIDICDADVKTIIQDISKKSVEELKAIVESVDKQIESAQSKFEEEVEKMQKEYEAMTEKLTKGNDAIREETNYKWVQQVLGTMDGGDKKSAMEDEL